MRIGQVLFLQGIETDIPRIRPWKGLLATEAQSTWLTNFNFKVHDSVLVKLLIFPTF